MNIPFNFQVNGIPHMVRTGQSVSYTLPAGCALRFSSNLLSWSTVMATSPFTATQNGHLRVDCYRFTEPVVASLEITDGE